MLFYSDIYLFGLKKQLHTLSWEVLLIKLNCDSEYKRFYGDVLAGKSK